MIKIQFRHTAAPPIVAKKVSPSIPGAYLFALRSTPRHYDELKDAIEAGGGARVWFGEALAYLRGQGVSIFRVEAANLNFLDGLYTWWREKETDEAFSFDINLFFNDREWVASLREHTPAEIRQMIETQAPRTPAADAVTADAAR